MDSKIREFPATGRLKAVMHAVVKAQAMPEAYEFEVTRVRSLKQRLLRRTPTVDRFVFQPTGWGVSYDSGIVIKRARVYLNLRLDYKIRKGGEVGEVIEYLSPWDYKNRPALGRWLKGIDVGITVYPFNTQQACYLLGKPVKGVYWGTEKDLEKIRQAPPGLFCPHTIPHE